MFMCVCMHLCVRVFVACALMCIRLCMCAHARALNIVCPWTEELVHSVFWVSLFF